MDFCHIWKKKCTEILFFKNSVFSGELNYLKVKMLMRLYVWVWDEESYYSFPVISPQIIHDCCIDGSVKEYLRI